jgi:hypothetical protein
MLEQAARGYAEGRADSSGVDRLFVLYANLAVRYMVGEAGSGAKQTLTMAPDMQTAASVLARRVSIQLQELLTQESSPHLAGLLLGPAWLSALKQFLLSWWDHNGWEATLCVLWSTAALHDPYYPPHHCKLCPACTACVEYQRPKRTMTFGR